MLSMLKLHKLYPENYYSDMSNIENTMRKPAALSKSLIPIPTSELYTQIIQKYQNNNEKYTEELEVTTMFSNIFGFLSFSSCFF